MNLLTASRDELIALLPKIDRFDTLGLGGGAVTQPTAVAFDRRGAEGTSPSPKLV